LPPEEISPEVSHETPLADHHQVVVLRVVAGVAVAFGVVFGVAFGVGVGVALGVAEGEPPGLAEAEAPGRAVLAVATSP
jgi:hypothetical protein